MTSKVTTRVAKRVNKRVKKQGSTRAAAMRREGEGQTHGFAEEA